MGKAPFQETSFEGYNEPGRETIAVALLLVAAEVAAKELERLQEVRPPCRSAWQFLRVALGAIDANPSLKARLDRCRVLVDAMEFKGER